VVTVDTLWVMMVNTVLNHVAVGTVFQIVGVPSHFSHHVHAFLVREFPDHWTGKGGPIPWPPHSLDLKF
jgi:hypothetical protein